MATPSGPTPFAKSIPPPTRTKRYKTRLEQVNGRITMATVFRANCALTVTSWAHACLFRIGFGLYFQENPPTCWVESRHLSLTQLLTSLLLLAGTGFLVSVLFVVIMVRGFGYVLGKK
ncbi:hypothetical protein C1H76_5919 [Elsinoe australis]|uniref:Uncharacterized protein n=1 Tax=Elsinoe australis TaxID=40998 RepID=A0A4U7ATY8_9PEZI|nr:hypothetical protein C1H76_5919 [Elsinoe australis]